MRPICGLYRLYHTPFQNRKTFHKYVLHGETCLEFLFRRSNFNLFPVSLKFFWCVYQLAKFLGPIWMTDGQMWAVIWHQCGQTLWDTGGQMWDP
jgi:hypothetical protein